MARWMPRASTSSTSPSTARHPRRSASRRAGASLLRLDRGGADVVVGPMSATRPRGDRLGRRASSSPTTGAASPRSRPSGRRSPSSRRSSPSCGTRTRTARAPVPGARIVTPNLAEAVALEPAPGGRGDDAVAARASALARRWDADHVCVTCGARGAVLAGPRGGGHVVAAATVTGGDPCGAGDRFASRLGRCPRGRARSPRRRDARGRGRDAVRRGGGAMARRAATPAAGRSSPPAAASTSSTRVTCARSRRPGRWATASSCA